MKLLFLCTGNSCRSQMAEGLARHYGGEWLEVYSAGTNPTALHPLTVEVMREIGIDITGQYAKGLEHVPAEVDLVVTVCNQAAEACPLFLGAPAVQHWSLPDPAAATGNLEEITAGFRKVRDDLRKRVRALLVSLVSPAPTP
jgi:arsenate reductase (thioredoxin)